MLSCLDSAVFGMTTKAGRFRNESGQCAICPVGFYCPGGQELVACPAHSTSTLQSTLLSDCFCLAGYYYASPELYCQPCQRGRYKPNLGNAECALTCPTNADSELASTSLKDCFCIPEFHANMDETGQLATCIACTYSGLICEGGFVQANVTNQTLPTVHSQPFARHFFLKVFGISLLFCFLCFVK